MFLNKCRLAITLFFLANGSMAQGLYDEFGALIRSNVEKKSIYLCFTGHDFNEGFEHVMAVLDKHQVKASFFFTGDFIRNNLNLVIAIDSSGHFVGAHSDKHLLYCDWNKRDSLLHGTSTIKRDIYNNLIALNDLGIIPKYFMPPYEWYNTEIVKIAAELDQVTVNFSPGTRSNADYTTPDMVNYVSSKEIFDSIYAYEEQNGMNGFHLLIHPGTSSLRADKFYLNLGKIISDLKGKNYQLKRF